MSGAILRRVAAARVDVFARLLARAAFAAITAAVVVAHPTASRAQFGPFEGFLGGGGRTDLLTLDPTAVQLALKKDCYDADSLRIASLLDQQAAERLAAIPFIEGNAQRQAGLTPDSRQVRSQTDQVRA